MRARRVLICATVQGGKLRLLPAPPACARRRFSIPTRPPLGFVRGGSADAFRCCVSGAGRSDLRIELMNITTSSDPGARIKRLPARSEAAMPCRTTYGAFLEVPLTETFRFGGRPVHRHLLPGAGAEAFRSHRPPACALLLELSRPPGRRRRKYSDRRSIKRRGTRLCAIEGSSGPIRVPPRVPTPDGLRRDRNRWRRPDDVVRAARDSRRLLSILRHVIERGIERDMDIYWGVRSERD